MGPPLKAAENTTQAEAVADANVLQWGRR